MDFRPHIEKFRRRFAELEASLSDPKVFDNAQRAQELSKEYARLKDLVAAGDGFLKAQADLAENRALHQSELPDSEMALMAKEEIARLEVAEKKFGTQLQFGIVPPEPTDSRNTIVEIRAGAGGSESALFAADLYRMYTRYAETMGWQVETMDSSASDLGGFREIIFQINGQDVYKRLKYESGVHRVQRVPATEAQGRIHTSTATVAVLPEAEEVDVQIKPDEIEVNVCRASGKGGQGVNTTDSAVQIIHKPTGHDRALRRWSLADQKSRPGDGGFAHAAFGTQDRGGKRQVRRASQRSGRHRRTQRKDPHLQFPAEPRHRSSD
jgi:peptide chain release factor 1